MTGTFGAASDGTSYRPYRVNGTYNIRRDGGPHGAAPMKRPLFIFPDI